MDFYDGYWRNPQVPSDFPDVKIVDFNDEEILVEIKKLFKQWDGKLGVVAAAAVKPFFIQIPPTSQKLREMAAKLQLQNQFSIPGFAILSLERCSSTQLQDSFIKKISKSHSDIVLGAFFAFDLMGALGTGIQATHFIIADGNLFPHPSVMMDRWFSGERDPSDDDESGNDEDLTKFLQTCKQYPVKYDAAVYGCIAGYGKSERLISAILRELQLINAKHEKK